MAAVLCGPAAGDVVGWRGDGTGSFPSASPPLHWAANSNVVWKTKLPKWSNASPILVGDRLFVCAEPASLICLAAADGRILWQADHTYADLLPADQREQAREKEKRAVDLSGKVEKLDRQIKAKEKQLTNVAENARAPLQQELEQARKELEPLRAESGALAACLPPPTHPINGFATPTPASDGRWVYALFGNGVAAGYDLEGHCRWSRLIHRPAQGWGHSTSPLLVSDKLIVQIEQRLTALDCATGSNLWEAAVDHHWGSPVRARVGDADVVVTAGGDFVKVSDGAVLARRLSKLDYCTPLVEGSVAYFVENGGKAIQLPAAMGEKFEAKALWETKPENDRYYASPILCEGRLWGIMQKSVLSLIDSTSGVVVASSPLNLGGTVYPSITRAGAYVYVSSDNGRTVVFKAGRQLDAVATNSLEGFRTCPLFIGPRMYVRGLEHLYCIAE